MYHHILRVLTSTEETWNHPCEIRHKLEEEEETTKEWEAHVRRKLPIKVGVNPTFETLASLNEHVGIRKTIEKCCISSDIFQKKLWHKQSWRACGAKFLGDTEQEKQTESHLVNSTHVVHSELESCCLCQESQVVTTPEEVRVRTYYVSCVAF